MSLRQVPVRGARGMMSGAVRFITPYEDGDLGPVRIVVSRVEGDHPCRLCNRSHPYTISLTNAAGEKSPSLGLDSWEDANHQVREWLPDGLVFRARWEPESDDDESLELFFDNRTEAIRWLLEPV